MNLRSMLYRGSSRGALLVTMVAGVLGAQSPASSPAQPAGGEQLYTVLIFEKPSVLADRSNAARRDAYWASYDTFAAALAKAGALRGGSALDETVATTVRGNGSADRGVSDARLGGYFVIAAASLADAESLARLAPPAAVAVELRPHRDNPRMAKPPR